MAQRQRLGELNRPLAAISDDELLRRLVALLQQSRRVEADLIAHIAEVDERRLYTREASPSMFAYCTEVLHLSEAEAYLRITVARASRDHPILLAMLGDGRLHLSGIAKLVPHLTRENRDALLRRATHRSKRQIEELIAELAPKPDAPASIRKLPERRANGAPPPALELRPDGVADPALCPDKAPEPNQELRPDGVGTAGPELGPDRVAGSAAPAASGSEVLQPAPPAIVEPLVPGRPASVEPIAPARYRVVFTASADLHDKLERLRALMSSSVPDGDLGKIIERSVTETLERLEARRFAKTSRPRTGLAETDTSPSSRHIPAAVRRAVSVRDADRCSYVDEKGRRCSERGRLEYHHRRPFGLGGDHSPKNIGLLCRAHNGYVAEHDYGRAAMTRYRRSGSPLPEKEAVASSRRSIRPAGARPRGT